jgi:hypothetical protein
VRREKKKRRGDKKRRGEERKKEEERRERNRAKGHMILCVNRVHKNITLLFLLIESFLKRTVNVTQENVKLHHFYIQFFFQK